MSVIYSAGVVYGYYLTAAEFEMVQNTFKTNLYDTYNDFFHLINSYNPEEGVVFGEKLFETEDIGWLRIDELMSHVDIKRLESCYSKFFKPIIGERVPDLFLVSFVY